MKKPFRIAVGLLVGLLLLVGGALLGIYTASKRAPAFYEVAVRADPVVQREASDRMLQQAASLASDVRKPGQWEAVFTEQQINGWLAVDLEENHADAIPPSMSDPRVAIRADEFVLACRYRQGKVDTVLSLSVDVYLAEPNVVALRIRKARAGALPLPLAEVLEQLSQAAERMELSLEWRQTDGDPVALLRIPPPRDENGTSMRIEAVRLGDGQLFVSGTTESR